MPKFEAIGKGIASVGVAVACGFLGTIGDSPFLAFLGLIVCLTIIWES